MLQIVAAHVLKSTGISIECSASINLFMGFPFITGFLARSLLHVPNGQSIAFFSMDILSLFARPFQEITVVQHSSRTVYCLYLSFEWRLLSRSLIWRTKPEVPHVVGLHFFPFICQHMRAIENRTERVTSTRASHNSSQCGHCLSALFT